MIGSYVAYITPLNAAAAAVGNSGSARRQPKVSGALTA